MSDRTIPCPECRGKGWFMRECWNTGGMRVREDCGPCKGSGTIPDRRSPTAAERAVERIRDAMVGVNCQHCQLFVDAVRKIIREEEGR